MLSSSQLVTMWDTTFEGKVSSSTQGPSSRLILPMPLFKRATAVFIGSLQPLLPPPFAVGTASRATRFPFSQLHIPAVYFAKTSLSDGPILWHTEVLMSEISGFWGKNGGKKFRYL